VSRRHHGRITFNSDQSLLEQDAAIVEGAASGARKRGEGHSGLIDGETCRLAAFAQVGAGCHRVLSEQPEAGSKKPLPEATCASGGRAISGLG
jgi:hypothetical protein